jgi:putative peptidoglycan lipid II flippase
VSRSVAGSAKVIAVCIILSRVLGMVRDMLNAKFLGAGLVWDAFVLAFIVPNLFRRLFGEGALTAAFVPVFVERLRDSGRQGAFRVLNVVFSGLFIVLLGIVVISVGFTFCFVWFFSSQKVRIFCELLRIMMPYMVLICSTAILGAALNGLGHFFTPAFSQVVINLVWICALIFAGGYFGIGAYEMVYVIAFAVLIGGVLQFLIQFPPLIKRGYRFRFTIYKGDGALGEVIRLFMPVVVGLSLVQVNEIIDNVVASLCIAGHGAVSSLYYANRLVQLPVALIGVALATAVFPLLVQRNAEGTGELGGVVHRAMRFCIFVAIPASIGLILFAQPIVKILFERGEFGHGDTISTAGVLMCYCFGIWCYCCNMILIRAFYARKDAFTPLRVSGIMVLLNFVLNMILVWPMKQAGLALSTSICGFINFCLLVGLLNRGVKLGLRDFMIALVKFLFFGIVMGAVCMGLFFGIFNGVAEVIKLGVTICAGILIYFFICYVFRTQELYESVGIYSARYRGGADAN